jgi:hypothetical protein
MHLEVKYWMKLNFLEFLILKLVNAVPSPNASISAGARLMSENNRSKGKQNILKNLKANE